MRCVIEFTVNGVSRYKGDQSYVRTTNDSEETTVLSESPELRHAHNGFSSPKGQASQADYESLYRYYQNHRIEGRS